MSDIDRRESLLKMQSSFVESEFMRDSTDFLLNEQALTADIGGEEAKSSGSSWGGYAHQLNNNILDPSGVQDPTAQIKDPKVLKEESRRKYEA